MREEKTKRTVEIITYYSDDGAFSSKNKKEVEDYEALALSDGPKFVDDFVLPEQNNDYSIYKIMSRGDLLAWKRSCGGNKIVFEGFREDDIPTGLKGYFIEHFNDEGDYKAYYSLEHINRFILRLKQDIKFDRELLKTKENALNILEELKNE